MRIALIGQAAFGEKVLRGAGRRRRGSRGRLHAARRAPGKPNSLQRSGGSARHPRAAAGAHARPRGVRGLQDLRRRPQRHGLRHRHRAADDPEPPAAGHHPVPPVAAAPPPRRQRHQLGGHQRRAEDRPLHLLARRRSRHRARSFCRRKSTIEPDDTLGTVYFGKLFDLGVEAMLESVAAGQGRHGAQDRAGPHRWASTSPSASAW